VRRPENSGLAFQQWGTDIRVTPTPRPRWTDGARGARARVPRPGRGVGVMTAIVRSEIHSREHDLDPAGATCVDQGFATDGTLITGRSPEDLPAFSAALIDAFAGRKSAGRSAGKQEKQEKQSRSR
jgi:hypothetical protein